MSANTEPRRPQDPWATPTAECDLVMKGGVTSAVVYPRAVAEFATRYRLRGIGGTSAGAIGAALGAAAEYGRGSGGFEKLQSLPDDFTVHPLADLFQPQPRTQPLLELMLAITARGAGGSPISLPQRVMTILGIALARLRLALLGFVPGALLLALGLVSAVLAANGWDRAGGIALAVCGVVVAVLGYLILVSSLLVRRLSIDVPANMFGICTGLAVTPGTEGFTDWLARRIDEIAGLPIHEHPLTFGQLQRGPRGRTTAKGDHFVDLRMITTCLSQSRPYELPWDARNFYYDPEEWKALFPEYVMAALSDAPARPSTRDGVSAWQDEYAANRLPGRRLVRLPETAHLPVVVAVRLSVSYPLLISAVPLYSIDYRDPETRAAIHDFRAGTSTAAGARGPRFQKLWFSDGGICSNFPVSMFDTALPTRPTFAIDLGSYETSAEEPNQWVRYAKNNADGMYAPYAFIPGSGLGAISAFAGAIFTTSQTWPDNSYLDVPGFRDRIVEVLQTNDEGGLNLTMDAEVIERLADRGRLAATDIMDQFDEPHYPEGSRPTQTGWDNHRWVRFRALLTTLPEFLESFSAGFDDLRVDPARPPSYRFTTVAQRADAAIAADSIQKAAAVVAGFRQADVDKLVATPKNSGDLRRVPSS